MFCAIYSVEQHLGPYTTLCLFRVTEHFIPSSTDDEKWKFQQLEEDAFERHDHDMMSFLYKKFGPLHWSVGYWKHGIKYCEHLEQEMLEKMSPTKIKCLFIDGRISTFDYVYYVMQRYGTKDLFYKLVNNALRFEFPSLTRITLDDVMATQKNVSALRRIISRTDLSMRNFAALVARYAHILDEEFVLDILQTVKDKSGMLCYCSPEYYDKIKWSIDDFNGALKLIDEQSNYMMPNIPLSFEFKYFSDLLLVDVDANWSLLKDLVMRFDSKTCAHILMHKMIYSPGVPLGSLRGMRFNIAVICDKSHEEITDVESRRINELYLQSARVITSRSVGFFIIGDTTDRNTYYDTSLLEPRTQRYLRRFEWRISHCASSSLCDIIVSCVC